MQPRAKDLRLEPISAKDANRVVRDLHYSGKVDTRSQLHLGVFLHDRLRGALQFGPSLDKRKTIGLVRDTPWNGYLDLHRLALADDLPRNSESRALGVAMRLMRRHYPHVQWVLSYADAAQCGDGTIYRAAGFLLTAIKRNTSMWRLPDGTVHASIVFEPGFGGSSHGGVKGRYGKSGSETSTAFLRRIGAEQLPGYQLRYLYPLDPTVPDRLTVPVIPYDAIPPAVRMYRGVRAAEAGHVDPSQDHSGGATPTRPPQSSTASHDQHGAA
jgi:hypothetical protein